MKGPIASSDHLSPRFPGVGLPLSRAKAARVRGAGVRHAFGTHCAAASVPKRTLQEWMGHAQLSTIEICADYAPSAQEKAMVEQAFTPAEEDGEAEDSTPPAERDDPISDDPWAR